MQKKWPKDAFRHPYGSCRCRESRNLPLVAEEIGNLMPVPKHDDCNPRTDR